MVDPNRKINRLTDKDIEFLDECEEEFACRYTEADEEFMKHCENGLPDPPVVDNWCAAGNGGHHNNRGGGYNQNYGRFNKNRSWNNQPRRGGPYRNHRFQQQSYNRENRNRGGGGDSKRDSRYDNKPPINVRRDYGNFVKASTAES